MTPKNTRLIFALASSVLLAAPAIAQQEFTGPGKFPSLRNITGLPGQGFPVSPSGKVDFSGAMSFATPIAYGLTDWNNAFTYAIVSNNSRPAFIDSNRVSAGAKGNGTFQFVIGHQLGDYGTFTYGHVFLSSQLDSVFSVHYQPPFKIGTTSLAIGLLDAAGNGGYSGETLPQDNRNTTTPFIVATTTLPHNSYVTIGYGSTRYRGLFGNASTNLTPNLKLIAEYDTFNWNAFAAYNIGQVGQGKATVLLGTTAGKFFTWSLNYSF